MAGWGASSADAGRDELGSASVFTAGAQQADGKLLFTGPTFDSSGIPSILLARFAIDGKLDSTFGGGDGIVTVAFQVEPSAIGVAADRKIVITGGSAVARFQPDGSLDQSFGEDGIVSTPGFKANRLTLRDDGQAIVAGNEQVATSSGTELHFALARYNPDGTLDPGFGNGGIVTSDFGSPSEAHAVSALPDGRILAAGESRRGGPGGFPLEGMALARFLADGTPDPSFGGGDGQVAIDAPDHRSAFAHDLELQPDGRILAAGGAWQEIRLGRIATPMIARFTADGGVDHSFGDGGDGVRLGGCVGGLERIVRRGDGILGVGFVQRDSTAFPPSGTKSGCMARYSLDGTSVATLRDGLLAFDPGMGLSALIQDDGRVIFADSQWLGATHASAALARYRIDGSLDPGFGAGGVVFLPEFRRCQGRLITAAGTGSGQTTGSSRRDVILGTDGADEIFGYGGNDRICAGSSNDKVRGGNGADLILGGRGSDALSGGNGADALFGNGGPDLIFGGPAGDRLLGGVGNDVLLGGPGRDGLFGGRGKDVEQP
jgi:uncharacterized delta-60 repeat protein